MALTWSEDVRWMVVWRREFRGQSYRHIRKRLSSGPRRKGPSKTTIKRIVKRFREEGGVDTRQGARAAPPANRIFDRRNDWALLKALADSPGDMLDEIRDKLTALTGARPHVSTVCRAIWRLRHSRKRVRLRHAQRRLLLVPSLHPPSRSSAATLRRGASARRCASS
jgi:transposase|tara:strand:- start:947 stop:1447 length:501 start_codon:yes stop_codon:yes gene_type:complete